ncbi:tetratricopeptide repeat protein [Pseudoflavitalea rhizosphaerae]|uniref:tetratricopeptide repeat protein n=1 Tax=Pseudoflavitalea rhizosphaerae TaxID=1884793 RepID=UPI000F8DA0A9|nr:tetratricopeptide repeat protein [Pseudoflavitalea rhizosphaerae]
MKWPLFIPVFLSLASKAAAQELPPAIDSLKALLAQHRHADTVRLKWLNELSFLYHSADPEEGLRMAAEAALLAGKLKNKQGLAVAYSRQGTNYWALGKDSLAMDASNKALALYNESGNRLSYAKTLNNRALNYYAIGKYVEALRDHEEALSVFRDLGHQEGVRHSLNNMGTVFLTLNDYRRALDAFFNASKVNAPDNGSLEASIQLNIGLVYKNQGEYSRAMKYEEQALQLYSSMGDRRGMALGYSNIGSLFDLMGEPGKAIGFYEKAMNINLAIGNQLRLASDLTNTGIVLSRMQQPDSAILYLEKAVAIYREKNDKGNLSIALIALSNCKDSMFTGRSHLPDVLALQQEALLAAQESGIPLRESEALEMISHTYERMGDAAQALSAYKRHVILHDTIFNEEKARALTRKQMSFDFEKKETMAQAAIQRQTTMKNAVLLGGSGLLLAGIFGFILYKRRRDMLFKQQEAAHNVMVAETELKALRAQLSPHFIFNSLNSVGDYILKHPAVEAREYLSSFASLMRMTLEYSRQKEITLQEELSFLELYMQTEMKRLKEQFTYEIAVDDGLEKDNVMMPPLLLQPFIENSIWHGFAAKEDKGLIRIGIHREGAGLLCVVDDNGCGRNSKAGHERKSLGIAITESRLAIINKQYNGNGSLKITDKANNGGTCVEIRLPVILRF